MKKISLFIFVLLQILMFTACTSQQELEDEMEQLKIEYAKYDQYSDLVNALEAKNFVLAEKILAGYKASENNAQVSTGALQEIAITNDNWTEYFEIKKITEWTENDLGETTGFITHVFVTISDAYADRLDLNNSDAAFQWSALCSVKNCDVDLANRMVAYENVFKSNSTTFGDPERLSGTVALKRDTINRTHWEQYQAVAEIGEIVIVGEYLLGTEMKPVCFDYDEVTIVQAEGLLTLMNSGE